MIEQGDKQWGERWKETASIATEFDQWNYTIACVEWFQLFFFLFSFLTNPFLEQFTLSYAQLLLFPLCSVLTLETVSPIVYNSFRHSWVPVFNAFFSSCQQQEKHYENIRKLFTENTHHKQFRFPNSMQTGNTNKLSYTLYPSQLCLSFPLIQATFIYIVRLA